MIEDVPNQMLNAMNKRIDSDGEKSVSAKFNALMLGHELIIKFSVAIIVSSFNEDKERYKYRYEQMLVKADGIGTWVGVLGKIFFRPSATSMDNGIFEFSKQITEKVVAGEWQYEACALMRKVLNLLSISHEELPRKTKLLQLFSDFSVLRNKTRGHGAQDTSVLAPALPYLQDAYDLVMRNLKLLSVPCAHLHRNLSGKYNVSDVSVGSELFTPLRAKTDFNYEDGVYFALETIHRSSLVSTDVSLSDFWVANGGFNGKKYDELSYVSGSVCSRDASQFLLPIDPLPGSVTDGLNELEIIGNAFSNMPSVPADYISRKGLEDEIYDQIVDLDHHQIITLEGRGGIGKTYAALYVANAIAQSKTCPFECIIWLSARDVDLTMDRAIEVHPSALTIDDFAKRYYEVTDFSRQQKSSDEMRKCLADALSIAKEKPTLIIFDNFETVIYPDEVYRWIDSYVRAPNKVLITTRIRGKFKADFPIRVNGMSDEECRELIRTTGSRLHIEARLSSELITNIIDHSNGHPYVIKVMLGELSRHPEKKSVERVISGREDILEALFERTYKMLSAPAQRVFLTVSAWKSLIPELAVEAALIRQEYDYIDVPKAIDELVDYSFIEKIEGDGEEVFISVPIAARLFADKKRSLHPSRGTILEDVEIIRAFGVCGADDVKHGVDRHVVKLFKNVAAYIKSGQKTFDYFRPVLEYVSSIRSRFWLELASLSGYEDEKIDEYLEKYLQGDGRGDISVWWRLADNYRRKGDFRYELNTLSRLVCVEGISMFDIVKAVQWTNQIYLNGRELFQRADWLLLASELATALDPKVEQCDATELSQLAWLHVNLGNRDRAMQLAELGLKMDPNNRHCKKIYNRFEGR